MIHGFAERWQIPLDGFIHTLRIYAEAMFVFVSYPDDFLKNVLPDMGLQCAFLDEIYFQIEQFA